MWEDRQDRNKTRMNIPKRDKDKVAEAIPNNLTLDQAFSMMFKRYEQSLKELSQK